MSGARSMYSVDTQSEIGTKKVNIFLQAKRAFSPGNMDIKFLHQSAKNECKLELWFGAKE